FFIILTNPAPTYLSILSLHDAFRSWFESRWNDRLSLDISEELASIIEESWAREDLIPPYYIYVKMAYHLSQEARAGLAQFSIPKDRKSTRLNSSHVAISYAVFCLKK